MSTTWRAARGLARRAAGYARKAAGSGGINRESIARQYLRGHGIEIGALHNPLKVPRCARVRYVDRMSAADLREQYSELNSRPLIEVDIIDDGETLSAIPDESQQFVIANHFLEHCQNPIGAVRNMLRVLKPGGILYLAVPDKRFTFDVDRPVTPLGHLLRDDAEGPEWSRQQHFEEWTRLVGKIEDPAEAAEKTRALMAMDYSIHFHVWTQVEILELLLTLKQQPGFRFEIELFTMHALEIALVLRKR
jgi:predicted SAM-dependent methyltransferase